MIVDNSLHPDLNMAMECLRFIAPDGNVTFQTFDDNEERCNQHRREKGHDPLAHVLHGGPTEENLQRLTKLNQQGAGVFFMVNAGDGLGRKTANVTKVRAVFCDFDENGEQGLAKARQNLGRQPHMIVQSSPGKFHTYWLTTGEIRPEQFKNIQKGMAQKYGSDPKVNDITRVMRLPGFYHCKGEPVMTLLIKVNLEIAPYRLEDFADVTNLPALHSKKQSLASTMGIQGMEQGERNDAIFLYSCSLRYRGLSREEAEFLVREKASACNPPYPIPEALGCLERAYSYEGTNELFIDEFNYCHAVVWVGSTCCILKETKAPETGRVIGFVFCTVADLKLAYSDRIITYGRDDQGRKIHAVDYWLKHPRHRRYTGVIFAPAGAPSGYYNLYRGFAVTPDANGSCELYLHHIHDNIANGDPIIYEYILNWAAAIVQNSGKRAEVAIALLGNEGVGKGQFAHHLGKLFGSHYLHVSQGCQLTGRFNSHLEDKVLVFSDEAFWAGNKAEEGVIKALISEPKMMIEGKGKDARQVDNYLWLIFASNNDWVVPAGLNARRYLVLRVSDAHMQDTRYFAAIEAEMENGGREKLLDMLLKRDISGVNLRDVPKTDALLENKLYSLGTTQRFWFSMLQNSTEGDWRTAIPKTALREAYNDYCRLNGIRHPNSDIAFGKELKKMVPSLVTNVKIPLPGAKNRVNGYKFPPLADCRRLFEETTGQPIDWEDF